MPDDITLPSDAATESAPAEGTSPAASSAPVDVPEWDGNFEALDTQPWWKTVPETAREHFTKLHGDRRYLDELVKADEPTRLLQEKLDGLQAALGAEVAEWKGKHAKLDEAHGKLRSEYDRLQGDFDDYHASRRDDEVRTQFPDIYAAVEKDAAGVITGGALLEFARLTAQGIPDDRAAKMVRAAYDMPAPGAAPAVAAAPPREKPAPPASLTAMGAGGSNPNEARGIVPPAKLADRIRQVQREIDAEEGV